MNRNSILPVILSWLFALVPIAQAGIGDWHNYTYSDDAITLTSDGHRIFCGTTGGLITYDIDTGIIRKYLNSDGIGDVNIKSTAFDSYNDFFAGGSNATLTKIAPDGQIRIYEFSYATVRYFLLDLLADGEVLWVATEIGVAKFLINHGGGEFQDVAAKLGQLPREIPVRALAVVGDYIWAGTDSGLAFMEKNNNLPQYPQNWHSYRNGEFGLTNARIFSLAVIADTVFAGTADGVFSFADDSLWHSVGSGLGGRIIYGLGDNNGILDAATDNGIYRRNGANWELLFTDSLKSTRARDIAYDWQGNLWAAFNDGGFARFDGTRWQVFTVPGPAADAIFRMAIDSTKTIWLTHDGKGLTSFDGVNWRNYNSGNSGLRSAGAHTVEYDARHGTFWIGSWGDGLFSFDLATQSWVNYTNTNSPFQGVANFPFYVAIPGVAVDSKGDIWGVNLSGANPAGGDNTVMAVFNPEDSLWQAYYENAQQVPDNLQTEIVVQNNNVFIAGGPGVYWLDFGDNPFSTSDDIWHGRIADIAGIRALALDNSGRLFIGSPDGFAYYSFEINETFALDLPDGYRSTVSALDIDGLGNIWVGCDSGVVVLPKNFERNQINWINKFKVANSPLINNTVNHVKIDKSTGRVYIGTASGLSVYESGNAQPSPDLSTMDVYPNPVNVRTGDNQVKFLGVPAESEISIYTVSGDLVKRFIGSTNSPWDLTNVNNQPVAAGIYFFYVRSGSQSGAGKIAVIR
jgi:ligand-binding sensor domain-containing protein